MPRIILHIDMDYFFAQIEERDKPWLKNRPVVVGAYPKAGHGRGVVSTCNYLARKFGVRSGMPISEAWKRCSQAKFLPVRGKLYGEVSQRIMTQLRQTIPSDSFEQVSVDEAYLDCSSLGSFEEAEVFAKSLKKLIFDTEHLTASVGIGPNKMIAKIASGYRKPNGLTIVKPEEVILFLSDLSVDELPGVGKKTNEFLFEKGFRKVRDLLQVSEEQLDEWLGKSGRALSNLARGRDDRPVFESHETKSIGRQVTFETDGRDKSLITQTLIALTREVWEEVHQHQFRFRTITITCRYENFKTIDRSKTLPVALDRFVTFKSTVLQLFLPLFLNTKQSIRLVGVRLSKLEQKVIREKKKAQIQMVFPK